MLLLTGEGLQHVTMPSRCCNGRGERFSLRPRASAIQEGGNAVRPRRRWLMSTERHQAAQPEAEAALLQVRCCRDLIRGRVGVRVVVLGVFGDAQVAVAQVVLDAAAEVRFWERVRRDNEAEEDGTHYFFIFCFVFGMRAFFLCLRATYIVAAS